MGYSFTADAYYCPDCYIYWHSENMNQQYYGIGSATITCASCGVTYPSNTLHACQYHYNQYGFMGQQLGSTTLTALEVRRIVQEELAKAVKADVNALTDLKSELLKEVRAMRAGVQSEHQAYQWRRINDDLKGKRRRK